MLRYLTDKEFISWARRSHRAGVAEEDLALLREAIDRLEALVDDNEALEAEVATYDEEELCT